MRLHRLYGGRLRSCRARVCVCEWVGVHHVSGCVPTSALAAAVHRLNVLGCDDYLFVIADDTWRGC